ncbi:hypothetical protein FQA39_LY00636 [Lamprigera yunnana]|nr:hypothetical protein FQA39_LY00636 [Lamprigera yunnana]
MSVLPVESSCNENEEMIHSEGEIFLSEDRDCYFSNSDHTKEIGSSTEYLPDLEIEVTEAEEQEQQSKISGHRIVDIAHFFSALKHHEFGCSFFDMDIKNMPIDLYYLPASAPCRAVLLTAKAVGVDLNLKMMDLMKGDHLTSEFLKINPQHTIPTMVDNGFVLWESRAIMTYLVSKYGKDDSLYPKDPQKRAVVDQRLYFDLGTLYGRFGDYYYPVLFAGGSFVPEKFNKLQEAVGFLDKLLEGNEYTTGSTLTVADFSLVATVSSLDAMDFDLSTFKNVERWYEEVKQTAPGYEEANGKNTRIFKQWTSSLLKK